MRSWDTCIVIFACVELAALLYCCRPSTADSATAISAWVELAALLYPCRPRWGGGWGLGTQYSRASSTHAQISLLRCTGGGDWLCMSWARCCAVLGTPRWGVGWGLSLQGERLSRSWMSRWLRIELAKVRWGLCVACVLICCASTSIFLKGALYVLLMLVHWFTYWIIIGIINDLSDCGKQTRVTYQGVDEKKTKIMFAAHFWMGIFLIFIWTTPKFGGVECNGIKLLPCFEYRTVSRSSRITRRSKVPCKRCSCSLWNWATCLHWK
jgi:hypothetical protein